MTPSTMRLALAVCLLLGAGVVTNVLVLQDRDPVREAGAVTATPQLARRSSNVEPGRLLVAIKRELKARRYFAGQLNAELDLATRAAIFAYETDHGLALTAAPSDALLKAILLGAVSGAPQFEQPSEAAQDLVRKVQNALARLGYGGEDISGVVDAETAKAVRAFQRARGLRQNGRISARLIRHLGPALEGYAADDTNDEAASGAG